MNLVCFLQSWTEGWRQNTKLSKIGFLMECFAADFLRFFTKKHQNLALGLAAGYLPSNSGI